MSAKGPQAEPETTRSWSAEEGPSPGPFGESMAATACWQTSGPRAVRMGLFLGATQTEETATGQFQKPFRMRSFRAPWLLWVIPSSAPHLLPRKPELRGRARRVLRGGQRAHDSWKSVDRSRRPALPGATPRSLVPGQGVRDKPAARKARLLNHWWLPILPLPEPAPRLRTQLRLCSHLPPVPSPHCSKETSAGPGQPPRTPAHTRRAGKASGLFSLCGASLVPRSGRWGPTTGTPTSCVRAPTWIYFSRALGWPIPGHRALSAGPCEAPRSRQGPFRSRRSGGVLVGQPGVRMSGGPGGREPASRSQRSLPGADLSSTVAPEPPPRPGGVARANTGHCRQSGGPVIEALGLLSLVL